MSEELRKANLADKIQVQKVEKPVMEEISNFGMYKERAEATDSLLKLIKKRDNLVRYIYTYMHMLHTHTSIKIVAL